MNRLEDIWNTPEEDVETFMEAIKPIIGDSPDYNRIVSGKPDEIQAPELTEQISGDIRIQHGWHGQDYVWHIAANPKKPFRVSDERVIYATAKIMNDTIPQDVRVNIWLPFQDWDIREFTFKAFGLEEKWSITEKALEKLVANLFEALNTLV